MMFLFLSSDSDDHAEIVARVVGERLGSCSVVKDEQFPWHLSVNVDPMASRVDLCAGGLGAVLSDAKLVWNRRASRAGMPTDLDADDVEVIQGACDGFLSDFRMLDSAYSGSAVWVNDHLAQLRMEPKANQLKLAHEVGMIVPPTLISNDPLRIRDFVRCHRSAVVKPLRTMIWSQGDELIGVPTSKIDDVSSFDDESLRVCPMIYQKEVVRRCDLRVVVFGKHMGAVEIFPKAQRPDWVDWRPENLTDSHVQVTAVPEGLKSGIEQFCARANLIHAVFDFGISPDGTFVFFECNSQGRWLWMEQAQPELKLLARFVDLLCDQAGLARLNDEIALVDWQY